MSPRESRHPLPPVGPWREEHRLVADVGSFRIAFQVGYHVIPGSMAAVAGFAAAIVEPAGGEVGLTGPAVISATDLAVPARGWELRGPGIWVDNVCETPLVHWSYGLEAFGVVVDDPAELLGRGFGDRTALGWELEFEAAEEGRTEPVTTGDPGAARWQRGTVHGILLVGAASVEVEGPGLRSHRWGDGAHPPATEAPPEAPAIALPTPDGVWWVPS